jgi:hypothetical protein
MEEAKLEEARARDESGSEDEDQEEDIKGSVKDAYLLKACRENKYDEAIYWLEKGATSTHESDNWTPLLWASCNGNE